MVCPIPQDDHNKKSHSQC